MGWAEQLDAYRVTEIPRRPDTGAAETPREQPNDAGRTQRVAALVAAYHAGAEAKDASTGALAIGWVRHHPGGPVHYLVAGPGLVGSGADRPGHDVFLTLPGGARAQPLPGGALAALMTQLPAWRTIGGISDGLLPLRRPPPR